MALAELATAYQPGIKATYDLRIAKGRSQVLNIMDCNGKIERWEISGVLVPEYEARCLGAWGRQV